MSEAPFVHHQRTCPFPGHERWRMALVEHLPEGPRAEAPSSPDPAPPAPAAPSPSTLVVFVHGLQHIFSRDPERIVQRTWSCFDASAPRPWWADADLLFVGYESRRANIGHAAATLREGIPRYFPRLPDDFGLDRLDRPSTEYHRLILVGHSLGGVIIRQAVLDAAREWMRDRSRPPHVITQAEVVLFSPATGGARSRAARLLGIADRGGAPTWLFWNAPAYQDLRSGLTPNAPLDLLRTGTEDLASATDRHALPALRARTLWAGREYIVRPHDYDCDARGQYAEQASHSSVCKPRSRYERPWRFVEGASR